MKLKKILIPGWRRAFPPGCYVSDDNLADVEWDRNKRGWWLWISKTTRAYDGGKRSGFFKTRLKAMRAYSQSPA